MSGKPATLHVCEGRCIHLTASEFDTLKRLYAGETNPQIALAKNRSEHTVKGQIERMTRKMGVRSRVGLVVFAMKAGVLK